MHYAPTPGAKMGETQEQCSQNLYEMAEIFKKIIIIFISYKYINSCKSLISLKSVNIPPYLKYFLVHLVFLLILRPCKIELLAEII